MVLTPNAREHGACARGGSVSVSQSRAGSSRFGALSLRANFGVSFLVALRRRSELPDRFLGTGCGPRNWLRAHFRSSQGVDARCALLGPAGGTSGAISISGGTEDAHREQDRDASVRTRCQMSRWPALARAKPQACRKHVRMDFQLDAGRGRRTLQHPCKSGRRERRSPFADEHERTGFAFALQPAKRAHFRSSQGVDAR